MKKGTVYFFTGLAGAGKTTIGGLFYRRMKERKNDLVLLDGDQLRRLSFNKQSRYTTEERREGAFYNFEMCNMLAEQGIDVVLCSISMYNDCRAWAREHIENYKEIYIRHLGDAVPPGSEGAVQLRSEECGWRGHPLRGAGAPRRHY